MTVKEVKEKYKFYHIFINGDELYHKDNSVNNREVKSIKEKNTFSVVKRYMCQYRKVNGYFFWKGKGDYMKMYVPFCYEKMERIEVEADLVREAQGKAQDILDEMSWKDCGRLAECVDDSAQIDYDGIILDENQNIVEAE